MSLKSNGIQQKKITSLSECDEFGFMRRKKIVLYYLFSDV